MAKVNKVMLVDAISEKVGMSKKDTANVIDTMIEEITKQLQGGNEVSFTGFVTMSVSKREARQGVNPKTGEKIQIQATKVPKFRAGKALKEAVK